MSDNVKDELAAAMRWAEQGEGAAEEYLGLATAAIALLAERGMVVLDPDGEPLDVRPALLALSGLTARFARQPVGVIARLEWLLQNDVTGPLADACLAAVEVEG